MTVADGVGVEGDLEVDDAQLGLIVEGADGLVVEEELPNMLLFVTKQSDQSH